MEGYAAHVSVVIHTAVNLPAVLKPEGVGDDNEGGLSRQLHTHMRRIQTFGAPLGTIESIEPERAPR